MGNSQSHHTRRHHSHRRSLSRRHHHSHDQVRPAQRGVSDLATLQNLLWEKASRQHHLRSQHDFLIQQISQVLRHQRPQQCRTSSETVIEIPRVGAARLERLCGTVDRDIARMLEWQEYDILEAVRMLRERLREVRALVSADEE